MSRQSSSVMQKEFDKAKLDFPFEGDLFEIRTEKGNWIQTTRVTFRSYDGPRRITRYYFSTPYIEEYNGPVYYYGSNREGGWRGTFKVLYSQELKTDEVNNRYY